MQAQQLGSQQRPDATASRSKIPASEQRITTDQDTLMDHDGTQQCGPTVYCAACKDINHIAVSPKCPSRIQTHQVTTWRTVFHGRIEWHRPTVPRKLKKGLPGAPKHDHQSSSPTESVNAEVLAQRSSLRKEVQQLRKENQELKRALAEKAKPAPPAQPQFNPPKCSSRCSRSPTFKRTHQSRIDPDLQDLLNIIRSDVQKERAARQNIGKIRILLDSHTTQTTAMIQHVTSLLPQQELQEKPPRKYSST